MSDELPASITTLLGSVVSLQYRVAKLEGYSDEHAVRIAKRLMMELIKGFKGIGDSEEPDGTDIDHEIELVEAALDTEASAKEFFATVDSVIYKDLDKL